MNIGILGSGMVGTTLGTRLVRLGHAVMIGSRSPDNAKAAAWARSNGESASHSTFADAAAFGEMILLCTKGDVTLDILHATNPAHFARKVVIDVTNPLDFSKGVPPSLFVCNTDSLGEQVQCTLPEAYVVKSLNIVNCEVMVNPAKYAPGATMFVCGNDATAKTRVEALLRQFGWEDILDLGDITGARGMEMMLPLWLRAWMVTKDVHVAFKMVRHT
ncbi:MAG: NADP oxidoreductase [Ignavibacteria bacterium]